jgi:UDPglucose 6-dehydrogenase
MSNRIAVVGSGYVGTVVAACFAHLGHRVLGVEVESDKLSQLRRASAPFYEPGLDLLLRSGLDGKTLGFTDDVGAAVAASDIIFLCVGTPPTPNGPPDMSAIEHVAGVIAEKLDRDKVIVTKSTVPVGTGRWLTSLIEEAVVSESDSTRAATARGTFSVVSNPEFLREGTAVQDFLHPDRVVIGSDDACARATVADAYRLILEQKIPGDVGHRDPVPLVLTGLATAEMSKYAANGFLATKVSFANELARLCELVGADITEVTAGIGLDGRIGGRFLEAGVGWGGSCLGKDLGALVTTALEYGYHPRLLEAARAVNDDQRQLVVDELLRNLKTLRGARICLLGLAFKPGTDDLRDSPGVDIAKRLSERGAFVRAHDPMVEHVPGDQGGIRTVQDPLSAARAADAVVIATDWPQFLAIDLAELRQAMRGELFFDGRNMFNPDEVRAAGFHYVGIGRPAKPEHADGAPSFYAASIRTGTRPAAAE